MKLVRELMRKQQLGRQVHAWCWRTTRAESSRRGCKEWGKQLSILSSEYLGLKERPQQIPGKTSEISVHKRAVLGIAKKPRRTLPLVEDTHITSHPSCLKVSYRKSDQAMKSRIGPDPQPELSLRGNGNPPIEAVIENHFQVALGLYDGNNITRTSFSENIPFIIITVIVASAAGGDDKRKKQEERDDPCCQHSIAQRLHMWNSASCYWSLMFLF